MSRIHVLMVIHLAILIAYAILALAIMPHAKAGQWRSEHTIEDVNDHSFQS